MSSETETDEGQPELPFQGDQPLLLASLTVQYVMDPETGEPAVFVNWSGESEDQNPRMLLLLGMVEFARDSILRTYRDGEKTHGCC